MLIFQLKTGLRAVSWAWSKLRSVAQRRQVALRVASHPEGRLGRELAARLPEASFLAGGPDWTSSDPAFRRLLVPPDADLERLPDGLHYLSANRWLLDGGRLEDLWPRQETHFHYPIRTAVNDGAAAARALAGSGGSGPRIGFCCRSGWLERHAWEPEAWAHFLQAVRARLGGCRFAALGGPEDVETTRTARMLIESGEDVVAAVGYLPFGAVVELVRSLDFLFVSGSSLSVLADVLRVPGCTWVPPRGSPMVGAWESPESLALGRFETRLREDVQDALSFWTEDRLRSAMKTRGCTEDATP